MRSPPLPPPSAQANAVAADEQQQEEEETYHSSSDSDFDPDAPVTVIVTEGAGGGGGGGAAELEGEETSTSSEQKTKSKGKGKSRKRKFERGVEEKKKKKITDEVDDDREEQSGEEEDLDFDNSGDEVILRKAGKRRRRGRADEDDGEEEVGEGGLIKTRAQRAREEKERKPLTDTSGSTVDVDAMWANMNMNTSSVAKNARISIQEGFDSRVDEKPSKEDRNGQDDHSNPSKDQDSTTTNTAAPTSISDEEMIIIKRTYDFAGETISEEKRVPKHSAEARLHLESLQQAVDQSTSSSQPSSKPVTALRRPKKRTSMFETSSNVNSNGGKVGSSNATKKLNTVEKSKLDWAGFVDKEGISDELDEHSRAKEGYLGRMDFLDRMQAKREDELRLARGTRKV